MTNDQTLQAALALLSRPSNTITSEQLMEARDDLDLPAALADIERMEQSRNSKLLTADDAEIEQIDADIRAARRAWDRRSAASLALEPLIAAAEKSEAEEALTRDGEEARAVHQNVIENYVLLDKLAPQIIAAMGRIHNGEAYLTGANARFAAARRSDLMQGMPMVQLSRLTGVDGEFLPFLSRWFLHGYQGDPSRPHVKDLQAIDPSRRFGRLAELLPDAEPAPADKPAAPKLKSVA